MSQIISHLLRNQQQNTFGALLKFNTIFLPRMKKNKIKWKILKWCLTIRKRMELSLIQTILKKALLTNSNWKTNLNIWSKWKKFAVLLKVLLEATAQITLGVYLFPKKRAKLPNWEKVRSFWTIERHICHNSMKDANTFQLQ